MKKFTLLLSLVSLGCLGACSSDNTSGGNSNERVITANDFESTAGWNVDPTLLEHGKAHSGQYAIKVDKDHEFSLTFDMALGQATPSKIKTVHLEGWAYLTSEKSSGVLGLQIMGGPTNSDMVYGDGIRLADVVKSYNKWVLVSKDITLPDNITAVQHVRISLWRADATEPVLVDDLRLTIKD